VVNQVQERYIRAACYKSGFFGDFPLQSGGYIFVWMDAPGKQPCDVPGIEVFGGTPDATIRTAQDHADFTNSSVTGDMRRDGIINGGGLLVEKWVHAGYPLV